MSKDTKCSMTLAKGIVECDELHYALTPHFKVVMSNFVGLVLIGVQVLKDVDKLEVPSKLKVHSTFRKSLSKP